MSSSLPGNTRARLENAQAAQPDRLLHCSLTTREVITVQHYKESLNAAATLNAYFFNAAMEYWRAMSYPALYYARYL